MKYILWIGIFLSLFGCSAKEPALVSYTIYGNTNFIANSSKFKNKIIKVSYPQSLKMKMTQNMQFSYSDYDSGSYQNSEWSNNIGQLLQGDFISTLTQSKLFKGVISYSSVALEDYRLESTIFDFSHRVRGDVSDAIVVIQFSLIDTNSGKLVKSKIFRYAIPTTTIDAKGYADATNIALEMLGRDLIVWLES